METMTIEEVCNKSEEIDSSVNKYPTINIDSLFDATDIQETIKNEEQLPNPNQEFINVLRKRIEKLDELANLPCCGSGGSGFNPVCE